MNIYVGNISRDLSEDELRDAFASYGQVSSVNIIKDKFTGEYRGFAFVEMACEGRGRSCNKRSERKRFEGKSVECQRSPSEDR